MLWQADELSLAEAFISGELEVEGDLEADIPLAEYLSHQTMTWENRLRLGFNLLSSASKHSSKAHDLAARVTGPSHSLHRDKQAIAHHYDHPAEFYAPWLDQRMVYSCAYFSSTDDLDAARRYESSIIFAERCVCGGKSVAGRGMRLGRADRAHAARHYGVDACGIPLSEQQAEFTTALITQHGLTDRCRVELRDYRQLDTPESYDEIVSIGMIEHIGASQLPLYFQHIWHLTQTGRGSI